MPPPPAEGFVTRLVVGSALRAQPDGRLVTLVREGYEAAFDEIVRRYGGALRGYAAGIVGGSAEDVTQDALYKALVALRRDDREIDLRPWLYRILRNTALNDLRDRPPATTPLGDHLKGATGVAEEVERREEVDELIGRLHALPEPQRAAIVMRELEGLGHEEIAAALGVSGGAARQAIHRARCALRDGFGMAIPLPLLKLMLEVGSPTAEIAAGGAGAGLVLKAATATVLVAGTLGAGMALHDGGHEAISAVANGRAGEEAGENDGTRRLASTSTVSRGLPHAHDGAAAGGSSGRSAGRTGSGGTGRDDGRGRDSRDPSVQSDPRPPSSGGSADTQPNHDGSGSSGGSSVGDDRAGSGDGSSPEGGDGSGSGDGPGGGSEEVSSSDDGSDSNSGPDSGVEEEILGSGSGDSRDSGDDKGFSGQMQPQTQEER